jgi:predicted DCC family thiol-disulfide oxidoreductase YuxK
MRVLLYDGSCGFCAESVQFALRHDRKSVLRFAALDGAFGRDLRARHPALAGVDSLVLVEPGDAGERVRIRSDAALAVVEAFGGWWVAARAARIIPRAVRDLIYRVVARHRHRLSRAAACIVPTPEQASRFLP